MGTLTNHSSLPLDRYAGLDSALRTIQSWNVNGETVYDMDRRNVD